MKKMLRDILYSLTDNVWLFIFLIFTPLLFSLLYLKYSSRFNGIIQILFILFFITHLFIVSKSYRKFISYKCQTPPRKTTPSMPESYISLVMNQLISPSYNIKKPFLIFCSIFFVLWTPGLLVLILIEILSIKYLAFIIGVSSSFIGLGGSILIYTKYRYRFSGIQSSLPFFIAMIGGPPGLIAALYSLLPNV